MAYIGLKQLDPILTGSLQVSGSTVVTGSLFVTGSTLTIDSSGGVSDRKYKWFCNFNWFIWIS